MSRRIGITQRVEDVASYAERRDCLDQQWFVLLEQLGLTPVPVPNSLNNVAAWLEVMELDGYILSGGNDLSCLPNPACPAPERDLTEKAILDYACDNQLPVLGVCRGMQMMNVYLGGSLFPVKEHVGTRHSVRAATAEARFGTYTRVNSFHDWGVQVEGLAETLQSCLTATDGTIEAVTHRHRKWTGIMWHPEREMPFMLSDIRLIIRLFKGDL
ncbi:type 1 glutamine amidotransferase [Halomonas sp. M5N1S17]|uniref:type 1 glutamine amidotransferase n=1 Tax=Halomonas alkalisoli TaxID=2907158 RepID=UPI001F2E802D|nr:type 1 glutamine amidotransferase [Halomonas alkalisoli]